ncbi:MAG: hypothetical protein R2778_04405 [Saprospiraceae bacterium]
MSETTIPATPSITSAAYSGAALEWLNSLPDPPSKADLSTLGDDFAIRAIHELLDGKLLELPIHANHPASDWLIHFYFEARNREKVFGTKNLGIGYPFVTGKIGGQDVAAPLFVWQISLEPNEKLPDNWTVQHTSSHAILPNYPFSIWWMRFTTRIIRKKHRNWRRIKS